MKILKYGIVLLLFVTLWGCGKGNSSAPVSVNPGTGNVHPPAATWALASNHAANTGLGAKADPATGGGAGMAACQACHGRNFDGGTSNVSCKNIACHGSDKSAHKKLWLSSTAVAGSGVHSTTKEGNAPACAQCHAAGANSPNGPITVIPGTAPGCFNNTLCHGEGAHNFIYPGSAHRSLAGTAPFGRCNGCHSTGSVTYTPGQKPKCSACHTDAVLSTYDGNNPLCGDCHGIGTPTGNGLPDDATAGAVSPNRQYNHLKHNFTALVGVSCNACHVTHGGGTANHGRSGNNIANPTVAPVQFAAPYQALGGAANHVTNNGACTNVSCHGGQPTPPWTYDSTVPGNNPLACFECHTFTSCNTPNNVNACTTVLAPAALQYNGLYSGNVSPVGIIAGVQQYDNLHVLHVGIAGRTCAQCHDMTKPGVDHFATLGRQTLIPPGYAAPSVGVGFVYNSVTGNCTAFCHAATLAGNPKYTPWK